jgi:hypothetical protein
LNRKAALHDCFVAFSRREPESGSLEIALERFPTRWNRKAALRLCFIAISHCDVAIAINRQRIANRTGFAGNCSSGGSMVEPLQKTDYFNRVFVEMGAPTWPNGFDLDPINL